MHKHPQNIHNKMKTSPKLKKCEWHTEATNELFELTASADNNTRSGDVELESSRPIKKVDHPLREKLVLAVNDDTVVSQSDVRTSKNRLPKSGGIKTTIKRTCK